ncbi:MAG: nitroreductase family protein [Meiothermus sp.]|nr:nitroreductase family protein [Meiothermus sp.]
MPLLEAIRQHRSIRKYRPDPVPESLLTELLETGLRASSSGNMQAFSVVVTTDPELKQQLYGPHMNQPMVLEAPVLLTFCADFRRMRRWLALSNAPDSFDNFMSFMTAAIDAVLVSQNVALAAEARGLGICYMGSTLANCHQIGPILRLPRGVVPVVGFSLGYPDEAPALRDRLPLDGLVHREFYHEDSDERVLEVYTEREVKGWDRYMSFPHLRKMIEESGVENLAQVYSSLKYTRASFQEFSRNILGYLEAQDFMNQ